MGSLHEAAFQGDSSVVRNLSTTDMLRLVDQAPDSESIQGMLRAGFLASAQLKDPNPSAPFIHCAEFNRTVFKGSVTGEGPELWVAAATGKIVAEVFGGRVDVAIGVPRSATELGRIIGESGFLPGVEFVPVFKGDQLRGYQQQMRERGLRVPVFEQRHLSAYVKNRRPDGSRGTEVMYFAEPETRFSGKRVLLIEDMVAEGEVVEGIARVLKAWGAEEVHLLTLMSKGLIQGGTRRLGESPYISSVLEIVQVENIEGGQIQLAPSWRENGGLKFVNSKSV